MRKPLLVLIVVFTLILLSACGGSKNEQNQAQTNTQSQQNTSIEKEKTSTENQNPAAQMNVSEGGKSAKIPEKYPADVFPIYKDSLIFNALELDGSFTITAYSKDDVKIVMDYYKKVLEGAKVTNETVTDESFTSFGSKGGYTYQLDVGKSNEIEGYITSIAIMLMPEKK